jgi:exopolysaccharide biosynthesis polyprenyl glycosylphosphotransferase
MPRFRTIVLLLGDFALLMISYLITAQLLIAFGFFPDLDLEIFLREEAGFIRIFIASFSMIPIMYFIGMYDRIRAVARHVLIEDLLFALGISFLFQSLISYSRSSFVLSRYMMLSGSALAMVVLVIWRSIYSELLDRTMGKQRVLFVGNTPRARELAETIEQFPEHGLQSVGCLDTSNNQSGERIPFPGSPLLPIDGDLPALIEQLKPDRISVSGGIDDYGSLTPHLLAWSMQGVRVESIGDLYETIHNRVSLETVTLNQLVFSPAFRPVSWVVSFQEVYCRLISAVALMICWPIMILTAIAVRLDSSGPALLRQIRLGQGGVPFEFLKFRSMYVDADKYSGPVRAKENDPRITRVGRWIRLTRIDELPQFINVLRGEMMLVGPRPEMPALEAQLLKEIPLYTQRHRIKPGITGWAQIHHTPEDSIDSTRRKLEYDLFYIKKMSPGFDMLILFYTIKAVMMRIGAR